MIKMHLTIIMIKMLMKHFFYMAVNYYLHGQVLPELLSELIFGIKVRPF